MRNLIAWLRAFTLVALILGGCAPSTFYPLPEQRETRTLMQLVEAGEVEALDLDGLDPALPAIEDAFQNLDNVGLLEGSDEGYLSRQTAGCESISQRGSLLGLKLKALYGPQGLSTKYESWFDGVGAGGLLVNSTDVNPYNGAHVWLMRLCSVDYDGVTPLVTNSMLWMPGISLGQSVALDAYPPGTSTDRNDAPPNLNIDQTFDGITTPIVLVSGDATMNERGDIVVAIGYSGFGEDASTPHRYFDPVSEAAAINDALEAAQQALPFYAVPWNGQRNMLTFSQGGHAGTAAAREAQANGQPYDTVVHLEPALEARQWNSWVNTQDGNNYILMTSAYLASSALDQGELPGWTAASVFVDPGLKNYFSGDFTYVEVVDATPLYLNQIFTPAFLAAGNGYLDATEVLNWCPVSSTNLVVYHATDDDEVPEYLTAAAMDGWETRCPGSSFQYITFEQGYGYRHLQAWNDKALEAAALLRALR